MSNTIRIRTTPNGEDTYIKTFLKQDFDFIKILSLSISQEDVYRQFCSDYGVVVGRVVVNSGFGVPNAKVSIFIPLDDIDKDNPLIRGFYPYEIVTDKDIDGKRYNLLPKEVENNNPCFTPIGSFPTKREVLDNNLISSIYCKYYKFTTTTNHAGDFMIFGVPLGSYTLHVDADISDIGVASQRPYDLIREGTPEKFFETTTKFKGDTNLDKLPQVKTANIGVNVQPFWGDKENCQIGITRVDVDLNYNIVPSAIFMGSIFGDQDKDSISKHCKPRKLLGEMCEQISTSGTIEMIRETLDGQIERFDVDGGMLIDDDGVWAYQIPMNLDYVVTDEFGNLISTQNPNIGLPTRANVRFRIGMDETGGESRLRTRAKYLIPNNPKNINEIDYSFSEKTKMSSFRNIYWNKIYTVSNFISRYQKDLNVKNRNSVAIKNTDACVGDKTPFPYNKVNTEVNPIFFIICIIIKIIGFLLYIFNRIILPVINALISVVRAIITFINNFGANLNQIDYVSCLSVPCGEDGSTFAPGCKKGDKGYDYSSPPPTFYCDDNFGHTCSFGSTVGLDNCIAFEMAKSLNLFEFDFYNDWVNGSLYSFLLKYSKKRKGKEKFCELDCNDFITDPNYSGVDGNENGVPDNNCYDQILLDSSYNNNTGTNCQMEFRPSMGIIREGLVKKFEDELYYGATTHNLNYKLYATDLVCLGSVFDCDWQGFPKLQPYLIPTSYKMPPDILEDGTDCNGNQVTYETGKVDLDGTTTGLFFTVDCLGLHVNKTQSLNIRHICEIGVNIDEYVEDELSCSTIHTADGTIGSYDIDGDLGKELRDSLLILNSGSSSPNSFIYNSNLTNEFNLNNTLNYYGFATYSSDNGKDYLDFRGYPSGSDNFYGQPKHSYYYYFGIHPGKSALDKMNQRYFSYCRPTIKNNIIIESSSIPDTGNTNSGSFTFKFNGGFGPYTYTITSTNSLFSSITNSIITDSTNPNYSLSVTVNNLASGNYFINGVDSLGSIVSHTVIVYGYIPLYSSVLVTQHPTTNTLNNGEITIANIGGGTPPYNYNLYDYNGSLISSSINGITTPLVLGGLVADNFYGYKVVVSDSLSGVSITSGITLSGPTTLNLSSNIINTTCYDSNDGELHLIANGYIGTLISSTSGPNGYTSSSLNQTSLPKGTYVTNIVDTMGSSASITSVINSNNPQLIISQAPTQQQCDPNNYRLYFNIISGIAVGNPIYIRYSIDSNINWISLTTTNYYIDIPRVSVNNKVDIKFSNQSSYSCLSNTITYYINNIVLPNSILSVNNGVVTSLGLVGGIPSSNYPIMINGGISPYTLTYTYGNNNYSIPTNNNVINVALPTSHQPVLLTITDNVNCISNTII